MIKNILKHNVCLIGEAVNMLLNDHESEVFDIMLLEHQDVFAVLANILDYEINRITLDDEIMTFYMSDKSYIIHLYLRHVANVDIAINKMHLDPFCCAITMAEDQFIVHINNRYRTAECYKLFMFRKQNRNNFTLRTFQEIKTCFNLGYGLYLPGGIDLWYNEIAKMTSNNTILQDILVCARDGKIPWWVKFPEEIRNTKTEVAFVFSIEELKKMTLKEVIQNYTDVKQKSYYIISVIIAWYYAQPVKTSTLDRPFYG